MINQKEKYKNHVISGFFIFISTFLFIIFLMLLGQENNIFINKTVINTTVTSANNLKPNSAVFLKGIKIGSINKIIIIDNGEVNIAMSISNDYLKWIKTDSYVTITSHGVLGDKYLEIVGGSLNANAVIPNSIIRTEETGQIDRIITKGEDVLITATKAIVILEQLLSKIPPERVTNIIIKLDTLLTTLQQTSENFERIDTNSINTFMTNINNISGRVIAGPGTLNGLIYDRTLYDDLRTLFGGTKRNKVLNYFIRETIQNSEQIKE